MTNIAIAMRISTPRIGPLTPMRRPCSATTATTTARQPIEASWPAVAAPARSRTRGSVIARPSPAPKVRTAAAGSVNQNAENPRAPTTAATICRSRTIAIASSAAHAQRRPR